MTATICARLNLTRSEHGKDQFHFFYRRFLIKLFHEGLGGKKRTTELEKLIGRIPYLNGGKFEDFAHTHLSKLLAAVQCDLFAKLKNLLLS